MKEQQIEVFDENEINAAQLFRQLGITRNTARVMIFLAKKEQQKYCSRDIEIGTELSQPQVSIALKKLNNNEMK